MNKKLALVALALVVALGAAGCGKKTDTLTLKIDGNQDQAAIEKFSGSMKDLIARGGSTKCDFTVTQPDFSQVSTIYVDGKKMRFDGKLTMAGQPETMTHLIVDDSFNYVWSDNAKQQGIKMANADVDANTDETGGSTSTKVDMNMKLDMTCEKWTPDTALFTPPTDVTFTDFSEMLKNLMGEIK